MAEARDRKSSQHVGDGGDDVGGAKQFEISAGHA
jgi:hypothetical protein